MDFREFPLLFPPSCFGVDEKSRIRFGSMQFRMHIISFLPCLFLGLMNDGRPSWSLKWDASLRSGEQDGRSVDPLIC